MVLDALLMSIRSSMALPLLHDYFIFHGFIVLNLFEGFAIKAPKSELVFSSIDSL